MWGTIARMRVRPEVPEEYLHAQISAFNANRMNGMVQVSFYRREEDPREVWMVAMFETKEAYQRNAESPAQHAVYLMLRSCLESDPEWHDVDEIASLKAPGSG